MTPTQSDALVFFGATGDLAYKKIFPALQALARRGQLNVPVIGVAKAGWNLDQLRARALESVEKYGGLDREAFTRLSSQLRYVDGDYKDPATFAAVRRELGDAAHPAHYLAIPPPLFGPVVEQLASRVAPRAPAWWSRSHSARTCRRRAISIESCSARSSSRTSSASITTSASVPSTTCCSSASRIQSWKRSGIARWSRACRSRWPRTSASRAAAAFYDATGAVRDVIQNHLFQLLSNLAMEPPARMDSESMRDEKVKVLKSIRALERRRHRARTVSRLSRRDPASRPIPMSRPMPRSGCTLIRGDGTACPFYIRAGKSLPVTCTEVMVRLRQPPTRVPDAPLPLPNYFRFRIMPDQTVAFGVTAMDEADQMVGQRAEMVASRSRPPTRWRPTSASSAMRSTATPRCLRAWTTSRRRGALSIRSGRWTAPVREYEPGSWGPAPRDGDITPPGGWANPTVQADSDGRSDHAADRRARPIGGRARVGLAVAKVGTVPQRAAVGNGARGLQPERRCVELLPARSCAIARLSLGRGRPRRLQRSEAADVFRAGALERQRSDSEGAAVRPDQRRGQSRRGRQGVLLLSRLHADPLLHEVALQVSARGVSRTPISFRKTRSARDTTTSTS